METGRAISGDFVISKVITSGFRRIWGLTSRCLTPYIQGSYDQWLMSRGITSRGITNTGISSRGLKSSNLTTRGRIQGS